MIVLDATTKKLQIVLAGAITTSQLDVVATYVDVATTANVPTGFVSAENDTTSNSTTAVDIVAAPAANTQRQVKYISIENTDTVAATVTVRYNNNGTIRKLVTVTLAVSSTLIYTDGEGWRVITAAGIILSGPDTGAVQVLQRVYTNAQILLLPTTPLTLLASPGVGFKTVLIECDVRLNSSAGAYTNIDNDSYFGLRLDAIDYSNYVVNDSTTTPALTDMDSFFGTAAVNHVALVPYTRAILENDWGNATVVLGDHSNSALTLFVANSAAGIFTGGNAANTMRVTLYYAIEATA